MQAENVILHNFLFGFTMGFWRIKDYWPDRNRNLVRDWYDGQEDETQAEFDFALLLLASTPDWVKLPWVIPRKGRYVGLYEIVVDIKLPYENKKRRYRPIGTWRPDSRDFILFLVCRKTGRDYDPPLETALQCKVAWEQEQQGEIHDHEF
jgi:hypothetical protein